jgi:hypothetical protein
MAHGNVENMALKPDVGGNAWIWEKKQVCHSANMIDDKSESKN